MSDLPVNQSQCIKCFKWLKNNYGDKFNNAVLNSPFGVNLLYAIPCQETAIYWSGWLDDHTPDEILGRCVFDASGDVNGGRSAFPKNTPEFRQRFGDQVTGELIKEGNLTRAWRGFGPKEWVYCGYGIFQYDIQAILTDPDFFIQRQWYSIDECLKRVMKELNSKWASHHGSLHDTIRSYNGSGPAAENYAANVLQFLSWINGAQ